MLFLDLSEDRLVLIGVNAAFGPRTGFIFSHGDDTLIALPLVLTTAPGIPAVRAANSVQEELVGLFLVKGFLVILSISRLGVSVVKSYCLCRRSVILLPVNNLFH